MTLSDVLGIRYPLVLGPFGGLSSVELTAAVSNAGGLGSYGLYGYDGARITDTVSRLRQATDRPFAVNLWVPTGDEATPDAVDIAPLREALGPVFVELGVAPPEEPARFLPPIDEQLAAVLEARPAVLSVVFGVPGAALVDAAHERSIAVVGTATTVAEAQALDDAGVDAIVATGFEAGGHRVSFLGPAESALIGTIALVPQVVDVVSAPVIAAGGIADRRGVAAAFALGRRGFRSARRSCARGSPRHPSATAPRSRHPATTPRA